MSKDPHGWWSDSLNAKAGHAMWLTAAGGMACVTHTRHGLRRVDVENDRGVPLHLGGKLWEPDCRGPNGEPIRLGTDGRVDDERHVGPVAEFVQTFPPGSEPIVPPPESNQGDPDGESDPD